MGVAEVSVGFRPAAPDERPFAPPEAYADTPAGAIRIVRDRYPGSTAHAVVSEQPLPAAAAWA